MQPKHVVVRQQNEFIDIFYVPYLILLKRELIYFIVVLTAPLPRLEILFILHII